MKVWILLVLPLVTKVFQGEEQIPQKTVTKTSTELVPSLGKYDSISEITDTKPTSDSLSTESGKS